MVTALQLVAEPEMGRGDTDYVGGHGNGHWLTFQLGGVSYLCLGLYSLHPHVEYDIM